MEVPTNDLLYNTKIQCELCTITNKETYLDYEVIMTCSCSSLAYLCVNTDIKTKCLVVENLFFEGVAIILYRVVCNMLC